MSTVQALLVIQLEQNEQSFKILLVFTAILVREGRTEWLTVADTSLRRHARGRYRIPSPDLPEIWALVQARPSLDSQSTL